MTAPNIALKASEQAVERPLILQLDEISRDDLPEVGGKAWSLGELRSAGFPVPTGYVFTAEALRRFIEGAGLAGQVAALEKLAGQAGVEEASERLRRSIAEAPVPEELAQAVLGAYGELFKGTRPVAVRSSGAKEDLDDASFAGQYETVLNVRGREALLSALKQCWASMWSPRVLGYAASRAGGAGELGMGVVVQEMIDADVSGVLFSVDPLTGREEQMVIEAVFGLGEALVSGKANADRFVVTAADGAVVSREIAIKTRKIVCVAGAVEGKGTREEPVPADREHAETLSSAELHRLAGLGAAVQERLGRPVDVEWVVADGVPFIVQARPITKISFAPELGEWTTADFRDGGVSSEVCTPFMWSLYEAAFELSLPRYLRAIKLLEPDYQTHWTRTFFARPYWSLTETKRVMTKVPGFNERNFDKDLGVDVHYEGEGLKTPVTPRTVARAIPVLFALRREYRRQLERARSFKESFETFKRPFELSDEELRALPSEGFAARYGEVIEQLHLRTETTYFSTIFNTSNAMLDFKVQLAKAEKAAGEKLDVLTLVGGLEDLAHLRPIQDMHDQLGRLHREKKPVDGQLVWAFANRWRHKSQRELDLRVPRWNEDLEHVRGLLEQGLAGYSESRNPREATRQQHEKFLAVRRRALRALRLRPWDQRSFAQALDLIRTFAWWREEMREHSSYAYFLVRRWTLEAGRRLAEAGLLEDAEDVWFLRREEVIRALRGELSAEEAQRLARAGRRMMQSFRNFKNPNEIGSRHRFAERAVAPLPGATVLKGTAASPGRAKGRARVARNLAEASGIEAGEILVAVFTDPGWTPLMGRIGGVVTENGGVLCHAAVVSREYGIPAVLAIPDVTSRIKDGDEVLVDGTSGTVEVAPG